MGEMFIEIVKSNTWNDMGNNMITALSEGLAGIGVLFTVALWGMPVFLGSATVNIPLVVPATARLLLTLAADMILILARSFREASNKNIGQPLSNDLGAAARAYRPFASEVHKKIRKLVPRKNPFACFRTNEIRVGFETIIEEYRSRVVDDITIPKEKSFGKSDDEDKESDLDSDVTLVHDVTSSLKEVKDRIKRAKSSETGESIQREVQFDRLSI